MIKVSDLAHMLLAQQSHLATNVHAHLDKHMMPFYRVHATLLSLEEDGGKSKYKSLECVICRHISYIFVLCTSCFGENAVFTFCIN